MSQVRLDLSGNLLTGYLMAKSRRQSNESRLQRLWISAAAVAGIWALLAGYMAQDFDQQNLRSQRLAKGASPLRDATGIAPGLVEASATKDHIRKDSELVLSMIGHALVSIPEDMAFSDLTVTSDQDGDRVSGFAQVNDLRSARRFLAEFEKGVPEMEGFITSVNTLNAIDTGRPGYRIQFEILPREVKQTRKPEESRP